MWVHLVGCCMVQYTHLQCIQNPMPSLFQARYLVKAISTLLNFSKTEERRIKEYMDYKVRRCRMYLVNGTPIASSYQHIPV